MNNKIDQVKNSENNRLLRSDYDPAKIGSAFASVVGAKAERKLRAQRSSSGIWFGLGMMGLVGWSVAVPTLLGTALGLWLDARHTDGHSWTLALLVAGLMLGCMNAWHWVANEDRAMHAEVSSAPPLIPPQAEGEEMAPAQAGGDHSPLRLRGVAQQRGGVPKETEKEHE